MVAIEFPKVSAWPTDKIYGKLREDYHAAYHNYMPNVPAVLTHCTVDDVFDDPQRKKYAHTSRVRHHSMMLVPRRCKVHTYHSEPPISSGSGRTDVVRVEEEEAELGVTVDFNAKASIEVKKGSASVSVDGSAGFGANWKRSVKVAHTQTQTIEPGCIYQPTRVFARLVCDVVRAKTGGFAVASSSGKAPFTRELVSTRPAHADMEDRYRASTRPSLPGTARRNGRVVPSLRHPIDYAKESQGRSALYFHESLFSQAQVGCRPRVEVVLSASNS